MEAGVAEGIVFKGETIEELAAAAGLYAGGLDSGEFFKDNYKHGFSGSCGSCSYFSGFFAAEQAAKYGKETCVFRKDLKRTASAVLFLYRSRSPSPLTFLQKSCIIAKYGNLPKTDMRPSGRKERP